MKLVDKIIKIEEYLSSWYDALPITALHILFGLKPDELYTLSEEEFEDKIFDLKQRWEDMDFIDKVFWHDRHEVKFSDFTSGVELKH